MVIPQHLFWRKSTILIEYTIENVHFYDFYEKESITLL